MITGEELLRLCDADQGASGDVDPGMELRKAVRAYVAQEAMREAAVAWVEAILDRKNEVPGSSTRKKEYACNDAAKAYLALRAARHTETEGGK